MQICKTRCPLCWFVHTLTTGPRCPLRASCRLRPKLVTFFVLRVQAQRKSLWKQFSKIRSHCVAQAFCEWLFEIYIHIPKYIVHTYIHTLSTVTATLQIDYNLVVMQGDSFCFFYLSLLLCLLRVLFLLLCFLLFFAGWNHATREDLCANPVPSFCAARGTRSACCSKHDASSASMLR